LQNCAQAHFAAFQYGCYLHSESIAVTGVSVKVLVAEDDVFFQRMLQQVLAPDYEIEIAQDGDEAWAALQRPGAPRLAILDWVMPGLSGPQVCRKVRACPALSSMYLIILTSKNNEADIVSGLRAGADDYIPKPPITAELRARVRVGQRVLELQAAVEAQSVRNHQRSGQDRTGESVANGSGYDRFLGREDARGMEICPPQHCDDGQGCSVPSLENLSPMREFLKDTVENRHPHR
jgi:CheY-like chemotaxis protein